MFTLLSCAQTLYARRVLRAHGLCESTLQTIFTAVVVAKLMYGSSAWWRFATATDRQKLTVFIQRSVNAAFYTSDLDYDFEELCNEADFRVSMPCTGTTAATRSPQSYDFKKRPHTRQILNRCSYLTDCNFLIRSCMQTVTGFLHCCILLLYAASFLYSLTTSMFII